VGQGLDPGDRPENLTPCSRPAGLQPPRTRIQGGDKPVSVPAYRVAEMVTAEVSAETPPCSARCLNSCARSAVSATPDYQPGPGSDRASPRRCVSHGRRGWRRRHRRRLEGPRTRHRRVHSASRPRSLRLPRRRPHHHRRLRQPGPGWRRSRRHAIFRIGKQDDRAERGPSSGMWATSILACNANMTVSARPHRWIGLTKVRRHQGGVLLGSLVATWSPRSGRPGRRRAG